MVKDPSLAEFKPDLAIDKWLHWTCDGKGRHIKVCPMTVKLVNSSTDACTDDVYHSVDK